jgi:uncharacterized protein
VSLPQKISYITLGARDMVALRAFYSSLGWVERPGSTADFATYEAGTALLALYPLERLGNEAAPGVPLPSSDWNGITLGVNVGSAGDVDGAFRSALSVGARGIAEPVSRDWGGYSGYFADPEGNFWEITWAPDA